MKIDTSTPTDPAMSRTYNQSSKMIQASEADGEYLGPKLIDKNATDGRGYVQ
jgi:hypothetical protein